MNAPAFLSRYLYAAGRYIDKPKLFALRRRNVLLDLFEKLDRPWFHQLGIKTVIDIGANTGQFSRTIGAVLPDAQVYAFEPLPECFAELQRNLGHSSRFKAFDVALGAEPAEAVFERSTYTPSSSFLKMAETHREAFPYSSASTQVAVRVQRLDDAARNLSLREPMLIKIDVQGYEMSVLEGGTNTLRRADMLIVETSFETLYEGQPLFPELAQTLAQLGFRYAGALEQLTHPSDGRILQADSIFLKQ